jgi:Matrixin
VVAAVCAAVLSACVVGTRTGPGAPDTASPGEGGTTSGRGYDFLHVREDGEPVRWSTCRPIRYVVRPDHEPEGARALLRRSVERISAVTGLEFSAEGSTDEAPSEERSPFQPERYGDEWAPVLITYSDPAEFELLEGRAAGFGGPVHVRSAGAPRYVSGMVVLDAEQMTSMGSEEAMKAVMLHELAHVVGLGHVDDRGQLMNPVQYGREVTELQDGDIAGLRALGKGECYEPLDPSLLGGS